MQHEPARDPDAPEGRYANSFAIGHSAFEFLLDFAQASPERQEPATHTRIVTSPAGAMALLDTLRQAIGEYERTYGPVQTGDTLDRMTTHDEQED